MTRGEKPERRIAVSRPFVGRTRHYWVRPILGGLVEHEKPICLRTPENVVRTRHYLCICRMAGLLV